VSGFKVFATCKKQENSQQHISFHSSPVIGAYKFSISVSSDGSIEILCEPIFFMLMNDSKRHQRTLLLIVYFSAFLLDPT